MSARNKRRFTRLVKLQAKLKALWWDHRLNDCPHTLALGFEQRRREKLVKTLESELNDLCFYSMDAEEA